MREKFLTPRFLRRLTQFSDKHPELDEKVFDLMYQIASNSRTVRVHALHSRMKGAFAVRVSQSYRLVFALEPDTVIFIDIGSHDEVY